MIRNSTPIGLFTMLIFIELIGAFTLMAQQPDSLNLAIDVDYISRTQGVKHVIPTMPLLYEDVDQIPFFTTKTARSFQGLVDNPFSILHLAYRLLGTPAGGYGPPLSGVRDPFQLDIERIEQTCRNFHLQFGFRFMSESEVEWQKLSMAYRKEILKSIYAIYKANLLIRDFLTPVTPFLNFNSDSIERNYQELIKPWKEKQVTDCTTLDLLPSIELKKLSFVSRLLADQIQMLVNFNNIQYDVDFSRCIIETHFGLIGIFGIVNDSIYDDYTLLINLGGNDHYFGNPGSTVFSESRISILIDHSGDDMYSPETGYLCSGIMGIGLLIDLKGDDVYTSNNPGIAHSFFGTALIYDRQGNDTYNSNSGFSQGSAHIGAALLFDKSGDDHYNSSGYSQGFGGTLGAGILLDNTGNDSYNNFQSTRPPSFVLGAALGRWAESTDGHSLGGGYGIFIDFQGDDNYLAKSFSQGASYYLGMGLFYEGSGNDKYDAVSHSQGYAAHYGLASFYEGQGNDAYNYNISKNNISQIIGSGRDFSAGWFIDVEGDDAYYFGNRSVGIGDMNGIGIFWDKHGDDQYNRCTNAVNFSSESMGRNFEAGSGQSISLKLFEPRFQMSKGLFIDTVGKDSIKTINQ